MKKMHGIVLLGAALLMGSMSIPTANAVTAGSATIVDPADGATYSGQRSGPVVVDLSEAGAANETDTFEVSYSNVANGQWYRLATLSGSAARNEVSAPSFGVGTWAVRVDPTWLGEEYTVQSQFTVRGAPTAWFTTWGNTYSQSDVQVRAALSNMPAGTRLYWEVTQVDCDGWGEPDCAPNRTGNFAASGAASQQYELPLDEVLAEGNYRAELWSSGQSWDSTEFTVVPNAKLTEASAFPQTFFPVVREGYRDKTTIKFRLNQEAALTYRVTGPAGRTVRRVEKAGDRGRNQWTWDGRNENGETVEPGRYRITVRATNDFGSTDELSVAVTVDTDTVTRRKVIERRGPATTDRSRAGNCRFYNLFQELYLDCWAGKYAQATYVYRIPRGAFDVHHRIYGEQGCCDQGRIAFAGQRVSPTRYRTTVRVTNWRSYYIEWADLHYKYKVRR